MNFVTNKAKQKRFVEKIISLFNHYLFILVKLFPSVSYEQSTILHRFPHKNVEAGYEKSRVSSKGSEWQIIICFSVFKMVIHLLFSIK